MSPSQSQDVGKYGIGARRWLIRKGLALMGDARELKNSKAARRRMLQAYRWCYGFARPALEAHPELYDELEQVPDDKQALAEQFAGIQEPRWAKVSIWVEAWYRDQIFDAEPRSHQITAEDLLEDDPQAKSSFYAQRAYREACVDALDRLTTPVEEDDPRWASALYDAIFPTLSSLAYPVLERQEQHARAIEDLWSPIPEDETEQRRRRMDTVELIVTAWHDAAVFSTPVTPTDTGSADTIEEHLSDRLEEA